MLRYALALVAACCALVGTQIALASDVGNSTPGTSVPVSSSVDACDRNADHAVLHRKLALRNWRESKPLRGTSLCVPRSHVRKHKSKLDLYRQYRAVAPYRCHGGSQGYYAIPCYIVACESHFSWSAYNSSGAAGVYQIMAEWGRPFPVRSFRDKLAHHRIAASLSLSNWVCA